MRNERRAFDKANRPLRVLLREIDRAVDRYLQDGHLYAAGNNYLRTPPNLVELLDDLEACHPLGWRARMRGRAVLERITDRGGNPLHSSWLEDRIMSAFQLKDQHRGEKGAFKRDLSRIGRALAEPFIAAGEGIAVAIAVLKEMGKSLRDRAGRG